ncbi:leucine-rich repeat domain-containing protein [Prevotella communis]|uniref:leucine-rich repeat domain-containing protein n=1 Tax=Prevotella communis TaxID=2913614 RepID=UPI001EDA3F52|nr:leucine-rich repeat domain-containing protein [Prevotella communis]UKK57194.1 leucine-rich repeat domain-containing protein [Prevotella communis]
MKTISRYIMTLALLLTAVGGAWAQTQWESGDCTVTLNNGTLTVSGKGAMADYTQSDIRPWDGNRSDITSVVVGSGVTSVGKNAFESFSNLTSVTLPEDFTAIGPYAFCNCSSLQSITIPSTVTSIGEGAFEGCSAMTSVTLPEGLTAINGMTFSDCSSLTSITIPSMVTSIGDYAFMKSSAISDVNLYANPDNLTWGNTKMSFKDNKATQCHVLAEHLSTYQNNFSSVNVTFVGDLKPLPTPIKVTVNDDKTEATFKMPQYDVTATYTIKRDISVDVTAQVGDGTDGVRYRVKKDGNNKFIPADMEMAAVPALFTVNDAIEQKDLTQTQDYIVQIYAIDAEGQPTGNPMTFATFTFEPGIYAVRAVAADGSDYAGETVLSNTFQLFQGYEVEVAAKEFITYYKDEPLYADTETSADAELYTITSVNGDQAVLSEKSDAMPSNTPMLVYNKSNETKTFLLIPCAEPDMEITVAPEFVGTLEATTIAASTDDQTNYALNGKAFVFVKNDLPVAANKAWLSINTGVSSARITIVFEDATKITNTNITNITNGDWYTIDGRKVNAPSKKGIYIMNGKKVVVK